MFSKKTRKILCLIGLAFSGAYLNSSSPILVKETEELVSQIL